MTVEVRLQRSSALPRGGPGGAKRPVRLVHLGLGNFFRAHAAWYTERSPDSDSWGIAAFAGRTTSPVVEQMALQEGLYTLVTRAAEEDRFEVVGSVSQVHPATDHRAWLSYLAGADTAAVTLTVTEAGYASAPGGGLDTSQPAVREDIEALRRHPLAPARTVPGRLVSGLAARRQAEAGPISVVPCDNLGSNAEVTRSVLCAMADLVDPALASWVEEHTEVVATVVDRITPRPTPRDVTLVRELTGATDLCPVVSEPFHEWAMSGAFPAGRPRWEHAGATFCDDITAFERRKLWLLNGAHSLMAYAGSALGCSTVAEAVHDSDCLSWVAQWWDEAAPHVGQPPGELDTYRSALLERFSNPRIRHLLSQIAEDGSKKLPNRVLEVLHREREAGREAEGAGRVLAAWVCHLRGAGVPVSDVRASEMIPLASGPLRVAVKRVLNALQPRLVEDYQVVATVTEQAQRLEAAASQGRRAQSPRS